MSGEEILRFLIMVGVLVSLIAMIKWFMNNEGGRR